MTEQNNTNLPTVFMLSGQGSQYFHMAQGLFEQNPIFRDHLLAIDNLFLKRSGVSILKEILRPDRIKADPFDRILYTHPAIFIIEFALVRTLIDRNVLPTYFLGASLGTLVAANLAGCMPTTDVIDLIYRQAQSLDQLPPDGGMIAILDDPVLFENTPVLFENAEMAGVNMANHFVVSGKSEALKHVESYLLNNNITHQYLNVTQAFHSKHVVRLKEEFIHAFDQVKLSPARIPVVCTCRVEIVEEFSSTDLWNIVASPIYFYQAINLLENLGSFNYIDVGPSGTMAAFVRMNLSSTSKSKAFTILNPFGNDEKNFDAVIEQLSTN